MCLYIIRCIIHIIYLHIIIFKNIDLYVIIFKEFLCTMNFSFPWKWLGSLYIVLSFEIKIIRNVRDSINIIYYNIFRVISRYLAARTLIISFRNLFGSFSYTIRCCPRLLLTYLYVTPSHINKTCGCKELCEVIFLLPFVRTLEIQREKKKLYLLWSRRLYIIILLWCIRYMGERHLGNIYIFLLLLNYYYIIRRVSTQMSVYLYLYDHNIMAQF